MQELQQANEAFYDALWGDARLIEAERFNTWPLVRELVACSPRRLEVAPGLRLRLPLEGTDFLDLSNAALRKLRARGARVARGCVTALPHRDASFDLVCALDIIEHVEDDDTALAELARITRDAGILLLSTPLHPQRWTVFDDIVGHRRRYAPDQLLAKLARHGLKVERSAVFGMQPRSNALAGIATWFLKHQQQRALWWYHHVGMPLAMRFQDRLEIQSGMIATAGVDEVFLVCRKP